MADLSSVLYDAVACCLKLRAVGAECLSVSELTELQRLAGKAENAWQFAEMDGDGAGSAGGDGGAEHLAKPTCRFQ